MKRITLTRVMHQDVSCIAVQFGYDQEVLSILKTKGVGWSKTLGSWYFPERKGLVYDLLKAFRGKAYVDYSALRSNVQKEKKKKESSTPDSLIGKEYTDNVKELKLWLESKRYSNRTISGYTSALEKFFRFISPKPVNEITEEDMRRYVNEFILPRGLSLTYQNHAVNALKHFYGQVFRGKLEIENLERPRALKKLPNVLSKEEVRQIISSPVNMKHRLMLTVIYSCGLRRSELLDLLISDVDSKRNLLIIRQGKGNKDRIVPLSQKVLNSLREYYRVYRPGKWLFEGQDKGTRYSEKSLESVLKNALKREKITKPVSLHWLRHSYATHLLESGTDLRLIQELLGHKSSKTTEIYTHVSTRLIQSIKSPVDDMDI